MSEIAQKEGLASLYSGLTPTMLGIIPYAGVSFAVFETLKALVRARQDEQPVSTPVRLMCGGVRGESRPLFNSGGGWGLRDRESVCSP